MTSVVSHLRSYVAVVWDVFLSAIGYFILRRCFHLVAAGRDGLETNAFDGAYEQPQDPLAYLGAALILLALAANEQPGPIRGASETHF